MEEKEYKLIPMTFFWMFLGLLGTGIIAVYSYSTDLCVNVIKEGYFSIIMIIEVAVVLVFSLLFRKLPATVVGILYFVYSAINGLSLSTIFYVFELDSIVIIFVGAAILFGLLGFYGYKTKADISRWQPILLWTLIVGLVVSIINLFIGSSMLDIIVDWGILITMFGITVYDMNKLKLLSETNEIDQNKIHIYCAMQLYLDFINIFIRLLSLFGKRRR
ncbi:MAG: Bax inhibitor-1/YccA family protein [Bacilli bacterium]|nr:Bax inhibitor-1/YccA family protein [Bacilli bacterium]